MDPLTGMAGMTTPTTPTTPGLHGFPTNPLGNFGMSQAPGQQQKPFNPHTPLGAPGLGGLTGNVAGNNPHGNYDSFCVLLNTCMYRWRLGSVFLAVLHAVV